jgi:hypothetical protein
MEGKRKLRFSAVDCSLWVLSVQVIDEIDGALNGAEGKGAIDALLAIVSVPSFWVDFSYSRPLIDGSVFIWLSDSIATFREAERTVTLECNASTHGCVLVKLQELRGISDTRGTFFYLLGLQSMFTGHTG